jgi:hypothetical protein
MKTLRSLILVLSSYPLGLAFLGVLPRHPPRSRAGRLRDFTSV